MIQTPMDVLQRFPVRKSKKQKQAFRDEIQSYAEKLGYKTRIERGSMGSRNIIIGDPETASYLVTAHYDTPASLFVVPNFMVPCNLPLFILSQILITIAVLLPAAALTILTVWAFPGTMLWYPVMLLSMWGTVVMMMVGPANPHNANDNTSGVVTVLETAASMPQNLRSRVCFVLFDLEEMGLVGSSSYRKKHRHAVKLQTILNLDCVGDGDTLMLLPNKALKADEDALQRLIGLERKCGGKRVRIRDKGFAFFPSDQYGFPKSVGICALRGKKVHYCGRIHTIRDTILDYTNVNILRACLISYIGSASE